MTTTELVAGRELDALVAERVMGHVVQHLISGDMWATSNDARGIYGSRPPQYSTSIEAAWQVVEHIATLGNPQWNNFIEELGGDDLYMLLNLKASEAAATICRAALVAVGKS